MNKPALVVLSSLFPSRARPTAGVFIRERMFRVGKELPITVVSPQAWFPGQSLIRLASPGYRLAGEAFEVQQGVEVYRPRAACLPGFGRQWDGHAMALAALPIIRRLKAEGRCDIIDAHFAYPDGYAASLLGKWLKLPYTITMRGTEPKHLRIPAIRHRIIKALSGAARVFTVSNSLREVGIAAGIPASQFTVVGNGVDTEVFHPVPRSEARAKFGIPQDAKVLITVGALVERKGFHRVIALLPRLRERFPNLIYLAVGGASPEGDSTARLKQQVADLGLTDCVKFLGPIPPAELKWPLSASNVFVLPSSNEGWANVILEAMACGVPVIASDIGGNREVVADLGIGAVYPFSEDGELLNAIQCALNSEWDKDVIVNYALANTWESRVHQLMCGFKELSRVANFGGRIQ